MRANSISGVEQRRVFQLRFSKILEQMKTSADIRTRQFLDEELSVRNHDDLSVLRRGKDQSGECW